MRILVRRRCVPSLGAGALGVWLAACSASPPVETCWTVVDPALAGAPARTGYTLLAEPAVDGDGLAEAVILRPGGAPASFRVTDPTGASACVQLHSVTDADSGTPWVTPAGSQLDYGAYCVSCPQRTSVGVGGGVYVLPSGEPLPPGATRLEVRAAARECSTFLPLRPDLPRPARLRIEALTYASAEAAPPADDQAEGVIPLEVVLTPGSTLFAAEEPVPVVLQAALDEVNVQLRPGHLSARLVRIRRVALDEPLELQRGDFAALDRQRAETYACDPEGLAQDRGFVPLIFPGCLRLTDPVRMTQSEPEGFVPRIPDGPLGGGRAHGVYLRGRDCSFPNRSIEWAAGNLAKLITHELGHYLGLYHSVEEGGTTDRIDDTGADNVMNYRPTSVASRSFSVGQLRVLRRHPAVLWGG